MSNTHVEIVLDTHDTFLDICEKIRSRAKLPEVRLVLADNAVLRNYLNIRILQSVFPERRFVFIVSDSREKFIGESLGVKYYTRSDAVEFEREFSRSNILRHNFTFFEYATYEVRKFLSRLAFHYRRRQKVVRRVSAFSDSNIVLLALGLLVSVGLLSFIFYFAVSKTYVYISPELSVRTASRNLFFREGAANAANDSIYGSQNVIDVRPVAYTATGEYAFSVTTFDQASAKNAHGTLLVKNELSIEQTFRPQTRFVTKDGIVYRTSGWLKIPPARATAPGKIEPGAATVEVVADMYDQKGEMIGERGNIGSGVLLTIPGLNFNRDKIYGNVVSTLQGGENPTVRVLTQTELDQFKKMATDKLRLKAYEALKASVAKRNADNAEEYALLPVDDVVKYSADVVNLASGKIWDRVDEVRLVGQSSVSSYAYDRRNVRQYLRSVINEMLLFGTEKLISVNDDSIRVSNIVQRTDAPFSLKATTEMDATISYNFEDDSNALTKKLKNLIVNTTKEEARSILINSANIAKVRLEFSPFWLSRVVSNPDNVEFFIEQ